jgi:phospholipase C
MGPPRARVAIGTALAAVVALAACGGASSGGGTSSEPQPTVAPTTAPATSSATVATNTATVPVDPAAPCGANTGAPPPVRHVLWIFMENKSYADVIGSDTAPYENALAKACGLATDFHATTHPSLPNYIAATSGLAVADLGPFHSDCEPSSSCSTAAPSIFSQAPTWRSYLESMPAPCAATGDGGQYAPRHNPAVYYRDLAGCQQNDLPLDAIDADLANDTLPAFSFVAANLCHDTHDCSVQQGDAWLKDFVAKLVSSPTYARGGLAIFLTWDEGVPEHVTPCTTAGNDPGCHIPLIVVSPSIRPGTQVTDRFDHYSLLRTTQELLGLKPLLGEAANAASMQAAFGL